MPTYTITATFHVDLDSDENLSNEENYYNMLNFFESVVEGVSGVHFIKITDVEED